MTVHKKHSSDRVVNSGKLKGLLKEGVLQIIRVKQNIILDKPLEVLN